MRKKRVLFVSEASYLSTGYATYSREVLKRLHTSNQYDLAEFSVYGNVDHKDRSSIPWKNYPNMPNNSEESQRHYAADPSNVFGKWRFERACLDFKPDVVCTIRDFWMDSFIASSPYRDRFKWIWMPTVDSSPQNEEWIDMFASTDAILTYSDWAAELLKTASNKIPLVGAATPSADSLFDRNPSKSAAKAEMGIDPSWKIIGTVMRNQRRKLFPELFQAFAKYLKETGEENTYLYCHTSYPDNGWDLPKELVNNEISSRVIFTYTCECGSVRPRLFNDSVTTCENCKNFSSKMTAVGSGVSVEVMRKIYNCFDVYVQFSNSEGFGIPIVEAAACGVPVIATDYSAMESEVRKLNGHPLKLRTNHLEMETGSYRALPDHDHLVSLLTEILNEPEEVRANKSFQVRQSFVENFSWDKTAQVWSEVIDSFGNGSWDTPPSFGNENVELPKFNNNKEILDFLIVNMFNEPKLLNSFKANCLLRDLNFGCFRNNPGGFFYSEQSYFNRQHHQPFTVSILVEMMKNNTKNKNFWENARIGKITFKEEDWL